MLSDAPFTSPWSSEVLITGDYKLPVVGDSDDDEDIQNLYRSYQYTYDVDNHAYLGSLSGSSCMTTSSDCSVDDLYVDGEDEGFMFNIETYSCIQGFDTNLHDLIDSPVLNDNLAYNVVSSVNDNLAYNDVSSVDSDSSNPSPVSTIPEASYAFTCPTRQSVSPTRQSSSPSRRPSSPAQQSVSPTRQSSPSRQLSSQCSMCLWNKNPCKKWSHMSKSEKAKMVDELSLTISRELGLREQMDIIKIINPTASFDKRPAEFVIDLNSIDDTKLEKIHNVVTFHCVHSSDINDNHRSQHKKFSKKNKNSDRKPRVAKQRTQKEYRQKLKEKRSGLFVKEERLAVSRMSMEEDIDIVG